MSDAAIPTSMCVPSTTGESEMPIADSANRMGPYKLLQQIGEGGCGVVFMAEQEEPVHRLVALKAIKPGMDTKNVIARFEAERQALALMDHPNIARVIDAGTTAHGQPYFVMELVRGSRITDYCDQHSLSTAQRLRLFIQASDAVQHAHQKGIIHRDIKPSNILVTTSADGKPVPKVIDFGIAKAVTGQRLTDKTLFTAFELLIGTPAYMSPEQAELTSVDIDTRSDIYSLGVLLYELLTGTTPFDTQELLKAGLDEVRRVIRVCDPVRPSTRLRSLARPHLTSISQRHHVPPSTLIREVRGDLDWIVMKAIEKDRSRRYATANALALDVRRFLESEAVLARPPSSIYKLQKLFLRNKPVFIGLGIILLLLSITLAATTRLVITQRRALKLAAALQLESKANAYIRQNKPDKAETMLRESLAIRRKYLGGEPPKVEAVGFVINSMISAHKLDEAVELLDEIVTPAMFGRSDCRDLISMHAELCARQGKWQRAASEAMAQIKRQPDNPYSYHMLAPLLVATTNLSTYQNLCSNILVRFSNTTDFLVADPMAKDCLILPSAGVDLKAVAAMSKVAVINGKGHGSFHFLQCCEALAQYRLGNYKEATDWAQESAKNPFAHSQAEAFAILAMAQYKLRNENNARRALADCNRVLKTKLPAPGEDLSSDWRDWIIAHALWEEAKSLIDADNNSDANSFSK